MTLKQKLKKLTTFFKWLVFTFPHIKIRIKHKLKAIQIKLICIHSNPIK